MNAFKSGGAARSPQDIFGGLFLVAISLLALYLVNHLPAAGRVGFASGTAPRLFAYCLLALGLWIMIAGFLKEGDGLSAWNWRGIITILGAVLLFAFMIRTFGLAVTGVPLILLASLAARDGRLIEMLIFAVVMTAFCCFLFPTMLGQPIPLWPAATAQITKDLTDSFWAVVTFPKFIVHIPAFLADFSGVLVKSFTTLFWAIVNFFVFMTGSTIRLIILALAVAGSGYGVFSALKAKKAGA